MLRGGSATTTPPPAQPVVTLGILGGSISSGEGVASGSGYADVLARASSGGGSSRSLWEHPMPTLHVLNRAVRATGCAFASFCVERLLPEAEHVDAIVLEFAVNDGLYPWHGIQQAAASDNGAAAAGGGAAKWLQPLESMERLLRRLRRSRPHTLLLLLYMCPPPIDTNDSAVIGSLRRRLPAGIDLRGTCHGLYTPLAKHYGVTELAIARPASSFTASLVDGVSIARAPHTVPSMHSS